MGNQCTPLCPRTSRQKTAKVQPPPSLVIHPAAIRKYRANTKIFDFYQIGRFLGKGTYGEVRECIQKSTKVTRAVKIIKKKSRSNSYREQVLQEFEILKQLDHMNILNLIEIFESNYHFYLVSELMEGGELFEQLVKRQVLTEQSTASIIQQILSALAYCNLKGVVHRDIKPQNILLQTKVVEGLEESIVKLSDFGLAKRLSQAENCPTHLVGSPLYMPPQVVQEECVNYKSDIWSVGVIMYIMLSGNPPFNSITRDQLFNLIKTTEPSFQEQAWKYVSQEGKQMVKKMLNKNYNERPSARALLKEPWFSLCQNQKPRSKKERMKKSLNKSLKNLKKFNNKNQLYMASLSFITSQLLSAQEVKEMREAFLQIDISKDGEITKEELIDAFKTRPNLRRNFGDSDVDQIISTVDLDRNGVIDYREFIAATIDKNIALCRKNLQIAFNQFDKNGDGQISLAELKQSISALQGDALVKILVHNKSALNRSYSQRSKEEQKNEAQKEQEFWDKLMQNVDSNRDGKISFDEFHAMISKCV